MSPCWWLPLKRESQIRSSKLDRILKILVKKFEKKIGRKRKASHVLKTCKFWYWTMTHLCGTKEIWYLLSRLKLCIDQKMVYICKTYQIHLVTMRFFFARSYEKFYIQLVHLAPFLRLLAYKLNVCSRIYFPCCAKTDICGFKIKLTFFYLLYQGWVN
jgi:hypothetical protein